MFRLFNNARTWFQKVFKYPKVEYIPISFRKITQIPINTSVTRVNVYPSLDAVPNIHNQLKDQHSRGLFMTINNYSVTDMRFRGGVCTVVVKPNQQIMEVVWLNSQYFPEGTTVHFTVMTKEGVRLTWTNYRV